MVTIDGKKLLKRKLDGISQALVSETHKSVVDIRFDPNSDSYCLIAYQTRIRI